MKRRVGARRAPGAVPAKLRGLAPSIDEVVALHNIGERIRVLVKQWVEKSAGRLAHLFPRNIDQRYHRRKDRS